MIIPPHAGVLTCIMGVWRVAKLTIPPTVPLARPPPLEDVPEEAQYRHSTGPGNKDFSV